MSAPMILHLTDPEHFAEVEDSLWEQVVATDKFEESILEDGGAKIFMPATFRLFNSYEAAQLMRMWIAVNWLRESHVRGVPLENVLDLGCSHSKLYQAWYNNGNFMNWPAVHYVGVEAHRGRLMAGRRAVLSSMKRSDHATHILGDIAKVLVLPWEFQAVVSMETFEHLPKESVVNLFATAYGNLVEGGAFIISGENPDRSKGEWGVYKDSRDNHHYEWPYEEVVALATENGFSVDRMCAFHAKESYYRRSGAAADVYNKLKRHLPTSVVNSICCLLESESDPYNGKQWMMLLRKVQ